MEKAKEQTIHHLEKFTELANSFWQENDMELYNYWKGQVMGICKVISAYEIDIDSEYYLKQLL